MRTWARTSDPGAVPSMPNSARLAAITTQPLDPDARPRRRATYWRAARMPRAPKMTARMTATLFALADVSAECAQAAGRLREPHEAALVQPRRSPVMVQQVDVVVRHVRVGGRGVQDEREPHGVSFERRRTVS
jgi:hypothetical protein